MTEPEGSDRAMGFDVRRVGTGLLIAAVGGFLLLVALLFMNWYSMGEGKIAPVQIDASFLAQATPQISAPPGNPEPTTPEFGAWDSAGVLGTLGNIVLLAAGLAALGLAALSAAKRLPRTVGDPARWVLILGIASAIVVVLRMLFPVEERTGYEFEANLEIGIFVALVGAIVIVAGGFIARREARPLPGRPPA